MVRTYCNALVSSVERLASVAPRWAQTVHVRLMNSPSHLAAYVPLVRQAPVSKHAAVRAVFRAVGARWPKKDAQSKAMLELLS